MQLGNTRVSIYSTSLVNKQSGGGREDVKRRSIVEHQQERFKPDVVETCGFILNKGQQQEK